MSFAAGSSSGYFILLTFGSFPNTSASFVKTACLSVRQRVITRELLKGFRRYLLVYSNFSYNPTKITDNLSEYLRVFLPSSKVTS